MLFTTEGITLEKKPFREYDETVFFLTKNYGKLELVSFGSKSPRSKRRYFLTQPYWLQLEIETKGDLITLKDLKEIDKINYQENDYQDFMLFQELLKNATRLIPHRIVDEEIYDLLRFLSQDRITALPLAFKKFLFAFSLLQEWNGAEAFNSCSYCKSLCSTKFYYIKEKGFIGNNCLKKLTLTSFRRLPFSLEGLFFYKEFSNAYGKKLKTIIYFYEHYQNKFRRSPELFKDWENLILLNNFFIKRYLAVNE